MLSFILCFRRYEENSASVGDICGKGPASRISAATQRSNQRRWNPEPDQVAKINGHSPDKGLHQVLKSGKESDLV